MMTEHKPSRLTRELPETARDMHAAGIMSDAEFETITQRHNAVEGLRAAAAVGIAALNRGDFREFATVDARADHLNKIADKVETGTQGNARAAANPISFSTGRDPST